MKRDLAKLIEQRLIVKQGQGKNTKYELSPSYSLLQKLNIEEYFQENLYLRKIKDKFNPETYRPPGNKFNIETYLENLCSLINDINGVIEKALVSLAMVAYLQAFMDGNKRTSRMIANSILIAHDFCPLSFGSIDEYEYKRALVLFYEQNNIRHLKKLFLEQFEFAVNNYFQ